MTYDEGQICPFSSSPPRREAWPRLEDRALASVNQILDLILHAGKIMLESGAETSRVEDTIEKLGCACGALKADAFSILGFIIYIMKYMCQHHKGLIHTKKAIPYCGYSFAISRL